MHDNSNLCCSWQNNLVVQLLALNTRLQGCGMGPWLVLVSPCFRENVVATCKIGSFLCSLDHLLQKNIIALFFWKSNFKMALIWKKGYFWPTFHIFLVNREKLQKFPQHILTSAQIYQIRFLFGMSPGIYSYSHHLGTFNK